MPSIPSGHTITDGCVGSRKEFQIEGRPDMRETQRRGFTMIETIMVVGLVAIVAAIGGPKLSAALQGRTTSSAADQFVLTHSLSRSTAIRYARVEIGRAHV